VTIPGGQEEAAQAGDLGTPWAPSHVPLDKPSAARMYDYFLGGYHNFAVDRRAADAATAIYPEFPLVMQANRAFLRRAVKFLLDQGISRFLDVGSGIPTVDNTHQVAAKVNPSSCVVYIDNDPIAVAHSAAMLRDEPNATVIEADVVQYDRILAHPVVQDLLRPGEPIGLLLIFLLHFILEDDSAYALVRRLIDVLPSGSYVAISHGTEEHVPSDVRDQLLRLYSGTTNPVRVRTRAEFERFFEGLDVVEPGITYVPLWRPEAPDDLLVDRPERAAGFAGVGRKP
jgi:hypothetical protein